MRNAQASRTTSPMRIPSTLTAKRALAGTSRHCRSSSWAADAAQARRSALGSILGAASSRS